MIRKIINKKIRTIEDQFHVNITIDNMQCNIQIEDTAGQDDYKSMFDKWVNENDGFILVYSIDNEESFNSIKERVDKIKIYKEFTDTIIVAGNKKDLELENKRKIGRAAAEKYCQENKLKFIECSAKSGENCRDVFIEAGRLLLKKKYPFKYNIIKDDGSKGCCNIF